MEFLVKILVECFFQALVGFAATVYAAVLYGGVTLVYALAASGVLCWTWNYLLKDKRYSYNVSRDEIVLPPLIFAEAFGICLVVLVLT